MADRIAAGWRIWGFTVLTVLIGTLVGILISVRLAESAADARQDQDAKARSAAREASCQLASTILAAYEEAPPTTKAGKNVASAWLDEYRILGCTPTK